MVVPELSAEAVQRLMQSTRDGDRVLLDVRQPEEFHGQLGHVPGAVLVPLGELPARLGELERWRDKTVVAICRSGHRSAHAAEFLLLEGFRDVWNMTGGTLAWREQGLPVEP